MISIAQPDLKRYTLPYLVEAYQIAGISVPDADTLDFMLDKFCYVLKTKFQNLPQDYIKKFLNQGAWGEYGEFKNISVKTLVHWVQVGYSKINTSATTIEDRSTMQQKVENIFKGLYECDKEHGTHLLEDLKQYIDKSISRNAQVKNILKR